MAVRAKFKVTSIKHTEAYDGSGDAQKELITVEMNPVFSRDPEHENHKFWKASPSGMLTLGMINPGAASQFVLGKEYYLEFTPAGE